MNIATLLPWLSARQYAPEGGFSGRTNKLVDGCYSHWVGNCWPLVQAALDGTQPLAGPKRSSVGNLYSREGLTRYILSCCQCKLGGLRDKPGKYVNSCAQTFEVEVQRLTVYRHPDSYHTCYALTGLSTVQYYHYCTDSSVSSKDDFSSAFSWKHDPNFASDGQGSDIGVFTENDRLVPFHPIFVIPHKSAEDIRVWFENQSLDL